MVEDLRTKSRIQKYHQLSLPLLFPVLDSAQHETWGRQGWNKDIWRSTTQPPPALPQTWQKEKKRRDENMQSVKHTTQWDRSSAESPKLSKNMSVELSDRSVREIICQKWRLGNLLNRTKKSKFHINGILERKEKVNVSRVNGRKLPEVGKRHKPTYSRNSTNPMQSEDTAHSWTSQSKLT